MQIALVDGDNLQSEPGGTANVDAWERFHRAIRGVVTYTPESGDQARALFRQALEHDRDFVDARVYMAWTYWLDSRSGFAIDRQEFLQECRRRIELILEAFIDALRAAGLQE